MKQRKVHLDGVLAVLLLGVWFKGDVSVGFIYMQF